MHPAEPSGPDLVGVVADAQHLRLDTRHGIVDVMRGGPIYGDLPVEPIPGLDT